MNYKLTYFLLLMLGFVLYSCKETVDKGTVDDWKSKIVFDNYLLPEVDSIDQLIKNEYFGFELFNNFKNNDSTRFYNQIISLEEQEWIFTNNSKEQRVTDDKKLKKNRFPCFVKLRARAIQHNKLDWNKALIEQVEYELFDMEDSKLFLKVRVKIHHNGRIYELSAPDCVYTTNGLKLVQPVHWEGISCWVLP